MSRFGYNKEQGYVTYSTKQSKEAVLKMTEKATTRELWWFAFWSIIAWVLVVTLVLRKQGYWLKRRKADPIIVKILARPVKPNG